MRMYPPGHQVSAANHFWYSLNFDDTYDGLGDQLDETGDDFNDDTFGGGPDNDESGGPPANDFDFFGRTAKVSNAINEEQMMFSMKQTPPKSVASIAASPKTRHSKPAKSGYEKYQGFEHVSDLQVDPALWGTAPTRAPQNQGQSILPPGFGIPLQQAPPPVVSRKMLSLEEVEAQMSAQSKKPAHSYGAQQQTQVPPSIPSSLPQAAQYPSYGQNKGIPNIQYHQSTGNPFPGPQIPQAELPASTARSAHIQQHNQPPGAPFVEAGRSNPPQRMPHQGQARQPHMRIPANAPFPGPSGQVITHPQKLANLSEEERAAFLVEEAKRAKRNHKIHLLSRDNGLMTPQDKNFITRIQLQQLMAATGNANDQDPDAALTEDFYYQVHSQIRGGPRQNPHQPLNHFAQTYLFQTGGRTAGYNRRQNRGDNHMQRMEQQVHRAVEAAKLKPKNKQLVIEGSLGKISFSNAKTPKPLLNIKRHERHDSNDSMHRPLSAAQQSGSHKEANARNPSDRKTVLKNIEGVYSILMKLEDDSRKEPPPPLDHNDSNKGDKHTEWLNEMRAWNEKLWDALKVLEPITPGSSALHSFICMLSYPKGKKAIPRVFRHLSTEQRVTMLTLIVLHLDVLDVIRLGQLKPGETKLPAASREAIELFSSAVTPSLFSYISEAPIYNVIGLLGLILDRVNVPGTARTRVGLSILTMLTSRATLIKEAGNTDDSEWQQWTEFYNRLFDILEPVLASVFPGPVNSGEDMYVWQFLAAIGSGASPEQQQRLVIAVK